MYSIIYNEICIEYRWHAASLVLPLLLNEAVSCKVDKEDDRPSKRHANDGPEHVVWPGFDLVDLKVANRVAKATWR